MTLYIYTWTFYLCIILLFYFDYIFLPINKCTRKNIKICDLTFRWPVKKKNNLGQRQKIGFLFFNNVCDIFELALKSMKKVCCISKIIGLLSPDDGLPVKIKSRSVVTIDTTENKNNTTKILQDKDNNNINRYTC